MSRPRAEEFNSNLERPTGGSRRKAMGDASSLGGGAGSVDVAAKLNPAFLALSRLRRRRFDDSIAGCTEQLAINPLDKAVWFIKLRALTGKAFVDDMDMEEEGVAEILMDDNAMSKAPRPGTSLRRPMSSAAGGIPGGPNAGIRPMSSSGRPLSGFARPGTQSRGASSGGRAEDAFKGSRPGTSRPMSVAGRFVRLGTQSMLAEGDGQFLNADRLDVVKYSRRPAESKAILDYLLYVLHNPRKALELAAECTKSNDFKDWWWKSRLGKIYYQLSMWRDSEKQFKSSIRTQDMISTYLELSKIYLKLDQPNTALDNYMRASEKYSGETHLILGIARVYDALNDLARGVQFYKKVLHYDASNVEAIACLASHSFYSDQPEIALRFYRRLLQMGVHNTELWTNIGICCFYASQYDMTLSCMEKVRTKRSNRRAAKRARRANACRPLAHERISVRESAPVQRSISRQSSDRSLTACCSDLLSVRCSSGAALSHRRQHGRRMVQHRSNRHRNRRLEFGIPGIQNCNQL